MLKSPCSCVPTAVRKSCREIIPSPTHQRNTYQYTGSTILPSTKKLCHNLTYPHWMHHKIRFKQLQRFVSVSYNTNTSRRSSNLYAIQSINKTSINGLHSRPIYTKTTSISGLNYLKQSTSNGTISSKVFEQQPTLLHHHNHPTIFPTNPLQSILYYPPHQQIRTILRPNKKKKLEKFKRKKHLAKKKGFSFVFFQRHNARKMIPITLRVHVGRLLNRATRGNKSLLAKELQQFVTEYMRYNMNQRTEVIIPYIRENFRSVAYQNFFFRILNDVPTLPILPSKNNNHLTKINGMSFVIQFRSDLMEVIYHKAKEIPTLDSRVKLHQLRLGHFEKLKKVIRQQLSLYVLSSLSLQPFEIIKPQQQLALLSSSTSIGTTKNENINIAMQADKHRHVKVDRAMDVVARSNTTDAATENEETENDKDTEHQHFNKTVGHIQRILKFSELSIRSQRNIERLDPMIHAKFESPNKYVYGWYQADDKETYPDPDVLTFVALHDTVPASLDELFNSKIADDNHLDTPTNKKAKSDACGLKVACFYQITILNPALQKIGLGEYMIRPIIQELFNDTTITAAPTLTQFATLLPLYSFRNWLLNNDFEDDISLLVINDASEDFKILQKEWECPTEQVIRRLKALLCRNHTTYLEVVQNKPIISKAVDNLLLRAAAAYLVRAKTPVVQWRCNPLEISTRYHVAQGASIYRINLNANPTEEGWTESFGLMTNHKYDLRTLKSNQRKYIKKFQNVEIHEQVMQYVPKPRKLLLTKEQRQKWMPDNPVRKKMIELSQNGKLFKVPLMGPPEFSRKRKHRPSLVGPPPRIRPSLLPPIVPTVGVSGLTVYAKPGTSTSALPSYLTRTIQGYKKPEKDRTKPSRTTFWPDEVKIEPVTDHLMLETKKRKSASQRGNRKKKKVTWDSVQ